MRPLSPLTQTKILIMSDYIQLCKRTNDPKLQWLEDTFKSEGIRTKREGYSSHAPILLVHRDDEDSAWKILSPIDDIPDDDPQWS